MNATTFQPTPEQIDACSQHTDSHGKSYWTVRSATDEDAWYTLRKHPGYVKWMCNCKAGREGVTSCWHRRTVEFLEAQEAQPYSPAPFSLLKTA